VEKLLFILAVVFLTMAMVSRSKLHKNIDDTSEDMVVEQNLHEYNPNSLTYAMSRVTTNTTGPARAVPSAGARAGEPAQAPQSETERLAAEVSGYVAQIQAADEHSLQALENGLAATTAPDSQPLRLALLQAALNIGNSDPDRLKDLAMREMTGTVVEPIGDSTSVSPEDLARVETSRMMVSTSYKVYLNASRDPDSVLQDTLQVLNFQRDQVTRDLIIYDCIARYPDLRTKLQPQQ
jgi:hypothetical protein